MKIKVYHVETDDYMRIISPKIIPHGYIIADEFDAEKCWHLCNWGCWTEEKPKNVHSDIERCNHGVIFYNPETKEYWLALSNDWLNGKPNEISDYVTKHYKDWFWGKETEL